MCKFKIEKILSEITRRRRRNNTKKDIKILFLNEILMHDLTSSDLMLKATQKGTKDQEN